MKGITLEIAWHPADILSGKNAPILSIDFHESGVFVTAGSDSELKLWMLNLKGEKQVEYITSLKGHLSAVNCCRFSPDNKYLASGGDDNIIIIWSLNLDKKTTWSSVSSEKDLIRSYLRGHSSPIYDLAWSPYSRNLVSGSIDNRVIVWDVERGHQIQNLEGHCNFVQGVAWDPNDRVIVSMSADRTMKIFRNKDKNRGINDYTRFPQLSCIATVDRITYTTKVQQQQQQQQQQQGNNTPISSNNNNNNQLNPATTTTATDKTPTTPSQTTTIANTTSSSSTTTNTSATASATNTPVSSTPLVIKQHKYKCFYDDSLASYFRRLTFTPDGCILLVPSSIYKSSEDSSEIASSLVFVKDNYNEPQFVMPNLDNRPSVVIKCFNKPYKLTNKYNPNTESICNLYHANYRFVYAVATTDTILIYDTEHTYPLCYLKDLHYAQLTDIAWHPNGNILMVSSSDGYCSMIQFEENELGEFLPLNSYPNVMKEMIEKVKQKSLSTSQHQSEEDDEDNIPLSKIIQTPTSTPSSSSTTIPSTTTATTQPTIITSLQNAKKNQSVKRITPTLISPLTTTTNKTFDPSNQPTKKRISTTLVDVSAIKLPATEFGEEPNDNTVETVDLTASNDGSKDSVQVVGNNTKSSELETKKDDKNENSEGNTINNDNETPVKRKDNENQENDNSSSKQRKINQNSITSYFAQH